MQHSGAATRRFYAAFYQWTVRSTNPTTRCTGNSLVSRRKQNAVRVAHSRIGTRSYSSSLARSNDGAFVGTVELLRSEEAQSHIDRPFDSLLAWGHVVRAKWKYRVKLEIAVPAWVLRHKEIRQEADEHEVKFRTPDYEEGLENDKLERLQLKGNFFQVHEIWRKLHAIGHTTGQTELEADTVQIGNQIDAEQPSADGSDKGFIEKVISLPDAFVKPIGRSGTIEYFQTKYGVQAEQLNKYGAYNFLQLKGDAKQIQEVSQFLEEIRTQLSRTQKPSVDASQLAQRPQIIRHNDLRSEDLNYWQFVRREQLSGRAEEEFCLPESTWQRMKQDDDVEDLRLFFGVIPKELGLFHDGTKRCIGLNGNVADVDRARLWLADFNVNIPQVQMDDEYLRIHAAATGLGANQEELAAPITEAEVASDHSSAESTLISGLGAAQAGTHIPETEPQARKDAASEYWYPFAEVKNFKVPDFLKSRVRSQFQSHDLLAEIQIKANLKALRYRKMPSGLFLQSIGTPHALDVARDLLQQEIDRYSHQNSTHYASIQELELSHNFALMQPTHFAVVKIPRQDSDIISTSSATFVSECNIKVSELRRMSEEYDAMEVVGTDEGIRLALGGLQSVVDRTRSERSEPLAKLEVLDAGKIKASELGEYDRAEKVPQQDLYRAALPDADLPKSYYAWVSIPSSLHRTMLERLHALSERRTNVSIDWVNRVVLRDENRVAIKLEGYRLEVLHAVESISEVLQNNGQRRGNELGQAKFIRFDLIEYANDGRLIVERLCDASADDPWTKKGVLPATPHKETAGDLVTERPLAKAAVSKSLSKENTKLTEDMRTALRHISQPVALVTSLQKGAILKSDRDMTHFRGVTVSSFCTVTLSPVPVISFNLRVPSRSWDAISSSGKLRVHLLKASPAGAAAAHAFTQRYAEPHEPFEHLSKHPNALIHRGSTPLLSWRAAVQTNISARIMPDKCVQVGDHMIVVAEVRKVGLPGNDDFGDTGGLAYGMQGYRQLGGEIKPMQIGAPASARAREQVQAATSAKSKGKKAPAHPNEKAAPRAIEDLGPSSPILDEESLQQVLEASETSYDTESLPAQAAAANQMLAESLKAVREAYRGSSEASATPPAASDQASKTTTAWRPPGVPTLEKAWGLPGNNTTQNRPMSIWARSACRFYSSSSSCPASPPISKKILKTTVGDYLAQPPAHTKRYTDLIYTARKNERIEAALEKGDRYTPEEAAELAEEVQVARRGVARELAVRNAQDLCAMLDEGRVVMSRVPFLESNLEQGLAVLLTEAKIKRDLLERGELGANEFEQAKASLMKHYDFIDAQLMRLRDMLEEDDIEDDDDR